MSATRIEHSHCSLVNRPQYTSVIGWQKLNEFMRHSDCWSMLWKQEGWFCCYFRGKHVQVVGGLIDSGSCPSVVYDKTLLCSQFPIKLFKIPDQLSAYVRFVQSSMTPQDRRWTRLKAELTNRSKETVWIDQSEA